MMKALDFNLAQDLIFNPETGVNTFRDSRMLLFDANAIGLLRQSMIEEIGWEKARGIILRFGYQQGFHDFLQMKLNYEFDSEIDLLAAGPVIHTWEGIVKAVPKEIRFDSKTGEFFFTGVWTNSYEAEQFLTYNAPGHEPVCWSLSGYASGWCTAFFGSPLIAIEPLCVGKGDSHCEWLILPPSAHSPEAVPYIEALRPLFGGQ
ncbi:MAG: XylR N-terminal domain-containing protein [Calditrichota bacterium]